MLLVLSMYSTEQVHVDEMNSLRSIFTLCVVVSGLVRGPETRKSIITPSLNLEDVCAPPPKLP